MKISGRFSIDSRTDALDRGLERAGQLRAAIGAEIDRFREDGRDLVRALLLVVEPVAQLAQILLLRPNEQAAELIQIVLRFSRRGAHAGLPLLRAPGTRNSFFKRSATSLSISASASRPVMASRICAAS